MQDGNSLGAQINHFLAMAVDIAPNRQDIWGGTANDVINLWEDLIVKLRQVSSRGRGNGFDPDLTKRLANLRAWLSDPVRMRETSQPSQYFVHEALEIVTLVDAHLSARPVSMRSDEAAEWRTAAIRQGAHAAIDITTKDLTRRLKQLTRPLLLSLGGALGAFLTACAFLKFWTPTHAWPSAWLEFSGNALAAAVLITLGMKLFTVFKSHLQMQHLLEHWTSVLPGLPSMITTGAEAETMEILRETLLIFAKPPQTGFAVNDDPSNPTFEALRTTANLAKKATDK